MFIAERTKACHITTSKFPGSRLQTEPAGGEHSQEMSARKNQYIAFHRAHATGNPIRSGANLFRRFSVRATVAEQLPVRSDRMNLRGSNAFVIAVVPLDQIGIDFGCGAEPG